MDTIDVEWRAWSFLANPPVWAWKAGIIVGLSMMLIALRGAKVCRCECHTQDGIPRSERCY